MKSSQANTSSPAPKATHPRREPLRSASQRPEPARVLLLGFVLAALVGWAFYPVLHHDLINLDDPSYVALNSHVQQGLTWDSIKWAFSTVETANWHPVTWLSHLLDYQLFGERVWGHHLSSLILYSFNTIGLFLVLSALTGALWRSFFVAAFFGLHPLRVESVAWLAERKDVLSTSFFIMTLGAYAAYAKAKAQGPNSEGSPHSSQNKTNPATRPRRFRPLGFYGLSLVLFALGLMSKPMLVTLPLVLLLLDFWPLQRLGSKNRAVGVRLRSAVLLEKIPFLLLTIVSCLVTMMAQRAAGIVVASGGVALLGRVENALIAYCRYLGKLLWPAKLAIFYPLPEHWSMGAVFGSILILTTISIFVMRAWQRAPFLAVGWGWFIITLVPVIGLVQVGWQAMADRYTYIPSIGVFLMLVWGGCALGERLGIALGASTEGRPWFVPVSLIAGTLVLASMVLTRHQLGYWKDGETLFRHTLAVTKDNAFTHHLLGLALRLQGRLEESNTEIREAIRIKPDYAAAYRELGYNLTLQHHLTEGIHSLATALRLAPQLPRTHKQLGVAFQEQGRLEDALVQFQQELMISPKDPEAHNFRGAALLGLDRLDEAIPELKMALRLQPNYPEAYSNLGIAFCRQGHLAEGIAQFEAALRLSSDYAEGHNNLAVALVRAGHRQEAIQHFEQALRIQPNFPGAAQQLRALTNAP